MERNEMVRTCGARLLLLHPGWKVVIFMYGFAAHTYPGLGTPELDVGPSVWSFYGGGILKDRWHQMCYHTSPTSSAS